jgi:hemerythrin-like domain-containing protein
MKITDALFAEHVVFHNLFDHVETVAPRLKTLAEIKCLAAIVEILLSGHSKTEDQLFIVPLEHCFEQIGHRETFHEEHEQIENNLDLIQKAKRISPARSLLLSVVVACRKHFDKEERIVFPMAEQVLTNKTLNELGQTWKEQRQVPTLSTSALPFAPP